MPLDTRIPLSTTMPQTRSFGQTLGGLAQIREQEELNQQRQLANEQRRRSLEDDDAIRTTMQRVGGDPDTTIDELYKGGRATAANTLAKALYDQRTKMAEAADKQVSTQKKQIDLATQIISSAKDQQSWDTARTAAGKILPPDLFQHLPPEYDGEKQKQLVGWGTTMAEKLKSQQDAIQNAFKAVEVTATGARDYEAREKNKQAAREHWTATASNLLGTAGNQQEWDGYQSLLRNSMGAPADVLAQFGNQFSPAAVQRAKALGLTTKEEADVAHQKVTERQADTNIALRRQEHADAQGGKGPNGRTLTPNRMSEIAQRKHSEYQALEKEFRERYADPGTGKLTLDPEAQAEMGDRKLQIEDGVREMLGQPPLVQAEAQLASTPGSEKELRKVRNTYRALTGQDAPIERASKLKRDIAAATDPVKAAALRKQLADLYAQYGGGR